MREAGIVEVIKNADIKIDNSGSVDEVTQELWRKIEGLMLPHSGIERLN